VGKDRNHITNAIENSHSLRKLIPDLMANVYESTSEDVITETDLEELMLPKQNPFTNGQILDRYFLPK
jgi:hypothetical protein